MAHLILNLHVTLPDLTLLVSLRNLSEECVEHQVMILDTIAYREPLGEFATLQNTCNQGILTQYDILVANTCGIDAIVVGAELPGSQALGIEHTILMQICVALLQ